MEQNLTRVKNTETSDEDKQELKRLRRALAIWAVVFALPFIVWHFFPERGGASVVSKLNPYSKAVIVFEKGLSRIRIAKGLESCPNKNLASQTQTLIDTWDILSDNGWVIHGRSLDIDLRSARVSSIELESGITTLTMEIPRHRVKSMAELLADSDALPGSFLWIYLEGDQGVVKKEVPSPVEAEQMARSLGAVTILLPGRKEASEEFETVKTSEALETLSKTISEALSSKVTLEVAKAHPGVIATLAEAQNQRKGNNKTSAWSQTLKAVLVDESLIEWISLEKSSWFEAGHVKVLLMFLPLLVVFPVGIQRIRLLLWFSFNNLIKNKGCWRLLLLAMPPFLWGCVGLYAIDLPYSWPFRAFTRFFLGGVFLWLGGLLFFWFYSKVWRREQVRLHDVIFSFLLAKGRLNLGTRVPNWVCGNWICAAGIGIIVYSVSLLLFFIGFETTGTAFTNVVGLGFLPVIFFFIELCWQWFNKRNLSIMKEPEPISIWSLPVVLMCLLMVLLFWLASYGGLRILDIKNAAESGVLWVLGFGITWAFYLKANGWWINNAPEDDPGKNFPGVTVWRSVFKAGTAMICGAIVMIPVVLLIGKVVDPNMWEAFVFDLSNAFDLDIRNSVWWLLGTRGILMIFISTVLAYILMFYANNEYDGWAQGRENLDFNSDRWDPMLAYIEPLAATGLGIFALGEPLAGQALLLPLLVTFVIFLLFRLCEGGEQVFQGFCYARSNEQVANILDKDKDEFLTELRELWATEAASPWINPRDQKICLLEDTDGDISNLLKAATESFEKRANDLTFRNASLIYWRKGRKILGSRTLDMLEKYLESQSGGIETHLRLAKEVPSLREIEQEYKGPLNKMLKNFDEEIDFRYDLLLFYYYPLPLDTVKDQKLPILKICLDQRISFARISDNSGWPNNPDKSDVKIEIYENIPTSVMLNGNYNDAKVEIETNRSSWKSDLLHQISKTPDNMIWLLDMSLVKATAQVDDKGRRYITKSDMPGGITDNLSYSPNKRIFAYTDRLQYESSRFMVRSERRYEPLPIWTPDRLAEICLQAAHLEGAVSTPIRAIFVDDQQSQLDAAKLAFGEKNRGLEVVKTVCFEKPCDNLETIKQRLWGNNEQEKDSADVVFIDVRYGDDVPLERSESFAQDIYNEVKAADKCPLYWTAVGTRYTEGLIVPRDVNSDEFMHAVREGLAVQIQPYLNHYIQNADSERNRLFEPEELSNWLKESVSSPEPMLLQEVDRLFKAKVTRKN